MGDSRLGRWLRRQSRVGFAFKFSLATLIAIAILLVGGAFLGVGPVEVEALEDLAGVADADDDGLGDARERRLGTDPNDDDTDGDLLLDGWEVRGETQRGARLPGSDPFHKDLYVQIDYASNVDPLTTREKAELTRAWSRMEVANPRNGTGVDLHLTEHRLGRSVVIRSRISKGDLWRQFYTDQNLGDRRCIYHQVVAGEVSWGGRAGWGYTPGYFSLVDATKQVRGRRGFTTARVSHVVHELLHNVVGRFSDESSHTSTGWLYHGKGVVGKNQYLSKTSERKLEAGFERSEYFQQEVCG